MKKFILLSLTLCCSLWSVAQRSTSHSVIFDSPNKVFSPPQSNVRPANSLLSADEMYAHNPMARTTTVAGKWYSYFSTIDALIGGQFTNSTSQQLSWGPMWWDSTVTRRYSNGLFANEVAGVCQIFDPIRYTEYNDQLITTLVSPSDIQISAADNYSVDSIRVYAAYVRSATRPTNIKDTLIISISPQENDYYYDSTGHSWLHNNPHVPTTDTTLFSPQPLYADSIHRAAFPDFTGAGATQTLDTIILDPMVDGHLADLTSHPGYEYDTLRLFTLPINNGTGAAIPAGKHFAVTLSFKSGDTWTAGDSVTMYDRFQPVFGYEGSSTSAGWMTYWHASNPEYTDYNGSSYIDSRGRYNSGIPDHWVSEFTVQDANNFSSGWPTQYLFLDAYLSCSTCHTVSVGNVKGLVTGAKAFPNPATDEVTISFVLAQNNSVNVSLINTMGQVISTQHFTNVNDGKAVFNTAELAPGIYFYTVEANGQRTTNRLVVVH